MTDRQFYWFAMVLAGSVLLHVFMSATVKWIGLH